MILRKTAVKTILLVYILSNTYIVHSKTTSAFNQDIYPLYTTTEQRFLLHKALSFYKEEDDTTYNHTRDHVQVHIAPFGITADRGRTIDGLLPVETTQEGFPANRSASISTEVPLGDLQGRTNLIALLFGAEPSNQNLPPTLSNAKNIIFGPVLDGNGNIEDGQYIDPQENLGCQSIYLKYSKKGLRFAIDARFTNDFGCSIATSVASCKNSLQKIIDKSNNKDDDAATFDPQVNGTSIVGDVNTYLVKNLFTILSELDQSLADDASRTSIETVSCSLFWRHIFELLPDYNDWLNILLIPYIEGIGSVSPGAKTRSLFVYDPVFGNNQHSALGIHTGMYIDFIDSIYIETSFSYTHFFKHDFDDVPVPNSGYQTNLYPFRTDITVQPGSNWHFGFKMGCEKFTDKFSCFIEYVMMEHKKNKITLKNEDSAFVPGSLENVSFFKAKLCNIAVSYAFSPNVSVGFLWQVPISQRNAFKSTTIMLSFDASL